MPQNTTASEDKAISFAEMWADEVDTAIKELDPSGSDHVQSLFDIIERLDEQVLKVVNERDALTEEVAGLEGQIHDLEKEGG